MYHIIKVLNVKREKIYDIIIHTVNNRIILYNSWKHT